MSERQLGLHYILDFNDVWTSDPSGTGKRVFELMKSICIKVGFRVVGSHLELFEDATVSPPGFASVICIDQSHLSAHCYSDKGILACDAFTCGPLERCREAGQLLRDGIMAMFPECRLTKEHVVDRFEIK